MDSDFGLPSALVQVTVTVTEINDPPVADPQSVTTAEETPVAGNVITDDTGSGVDSDPNDVGDGHTLQARVTGDRDPGYGSTSKMLAESAVCLAKDPRSTGGGIWTPASAMGPILRKRLVKNAGLRFDIL